MVIALMLESLVDLLDRSRFVELGLFWVEIVLDLIKCGLLSWT